MLKFLYFNNTAASDDGRDAVCLPATMLRKLEITAVHATNGDTLAFEFVDPKDGIGSLISYECNVTHDKGKEVKKAIANAIRTSSSPFIVIADELNKDFIHPDLKSVSGPGGGGLEI